MTSPYSYKNQFNLNSQGAILNFIVQVAVDGIQVPTGEARLRSLS